MAVGDSCGSLVAEAASVTSCKYFLLCELCLSHFDEKMNWGTKRIQQEKSGDCDIYDFVHV